MSQQYSKNKAILVILDGWGYSSKYHGNAIKQAYTPFLDLLWHSQPRTLLHASENHVGLPKQQMGNSEVGHTTIGAGRAIDQALVRISRSIETGDFFNNRTIHNAYQTASKKNKRVHIVGLCSDGGVHSHIKHLIALIKISQNYKNIETCIHIITDGRDTKPQSAVGFINTILQEIQDHPNVNVCTISGRYYSMDRDCRWQRTMKAYECLINNNTNAQNGSSILKIVKDHYSKNIYDEFIVPTRIRNGAIAENDSVICFNFRPDRMRQLTQALCDISFDGFARKRIANINIVTFTTYDNKLNLPTVFQKIINRNFLGKVISEKKFRQFRLAETEKYAHVTYFFNGGKEAPFPGEDRELIASPRVDTYDLTPDMSANHITDRLIEAIQENIYDFIVVNYANPDMVGHTGKLKAARRAIEATDRCIGKLLESISPYRRAKIIITADHGNADIMLDQNNKPCKSHTNNLVPFIIVDTENYLKKSGISKKTQLKNQGSLADVAPTILEILKIKKPNEMKGSSLIQTYRDK